MTIHLYRYRKCILVGTAVFSLLAATPAYAAQFTVEVSRTAVAPGSDVLASVYLNTDKETVNAVGGTFSAPANLEVRSVSDGGSIVPIWIEAPVASASSSVSFSGITPGGYNGTHGLLFVVTLHAKGEGLGALSLSDLQALLNDGKGTAAQVRTAPAQLAVSNKANLSTTPEQVDVTPPEPFTIQIAQTPSAFNDQKVLVFATQDKGSGMSHYEVCEGLFGSCIAGESSYVLQNQDADALITVVAYDNAGNARKERLFTSAAITRYALYAIVAILVGVVAGFLFAWRRD
jgi:hypothetical protein